MSGPRHLFAAWSEIRRRVRRAGRLALFTDFDGTLVPIRSRPDQVRLPSHMRRRLAKIVRCGATVGVVSGRRLEDVHRRVGLPGIWYVGAHGFFLRDPARRRIVLLNRQETARMDRVRSLLSRRLHAVPGIVVEPKGATIAVHYRGASRPDREMARRCITRALQSGPGLCLMAGKSVWEIFPNTDSDKWSAIQFILRREQAGRGGQGWLLFYLGDDTTDERVFEKMAGISVAVGKQSRTAARFFLRSPAEVGTFLEELGRLST